MEKSYNKFFSNGCVLFAMIFFYILLLNENLLSQNVKHPEGTYIEINGAKLWCEIEGNGEPILLIPGGPGNSHTYFHPWFSELAKNFKVIYFDAFGRGKSSRAKDSTEYTFARDVEDIEALRKSLGFDKWSVFGHSYGGMVAQAYALQYTRSVDKLIIANSFYSGEMWQANDDNSNHEMRNQYPERWEALMNARDSGYTSSTPRHQELYNIPGGLLYYYNASNSFKATRDSLIINPVVYYTLVGYDGDFIIGGDVAKLDFRRKLKDLKMPVLIIQGRFDRVAIPRFGIKFKDYAPQAKFVIFERSGHNPYIEEKEKFFELLRNFFADGK